MNHYSADMDSPSWTSETSDGSEWTRGIGGVARAFALQRTTSSGTSVDFVLPNLHGDASVIANASDTEPATPLSSFDTTEYGAPRSTSGNPRYGWLGREERSADTLAGFVLMGVRVYAPGIGQFLQVDPVFGGGTTAYSYADADPVNKFDLSGRFTTGESSGSNVCIDLWRKVMRHFTVLQRRIYEYNKDFLKLDRLGREKHLQAINERANAYWKALKRWAAAGCAGGHSIERYRYKQIPVKTIPRTVPYPIHPPVDPFICHHI